MTFVCDGDLPYRRLIVNDHIVDEAATRLKKQASMQNAVSFLTTLDESALYQPLVSGSSERRSGSTSSYALSDERIGSPQVSAVAAWKESNGAMPSS